MFETTGCPPGTQKQNRQKDICSYITGSENFGVPSASCGIGDAHTGTCNALLFPHQKCVGLMLRLAKQIT